MFFLQRGHFPIQRGLGPLVPFNKLNVVDYVLPELINLVVSSPKELILSKTGVLLLLEFLAKGVSPFVDFTFEDIKGCGRSHPGSYSEVA